MEKNLFNYYKKSLRNFVEAIINLIIFFPYFFSIASLLATLFSPWKNLVTKKTIRGFSFNEWFERMGFNFISRIIGFFMRLSIIFFYFIVQVFFLISIPIVFIIYLIFLPLLFFIQYFGKSESDNKAWEKQQFLSTHLLKPENKEIVENWFEDYYGKQYLKKQWWKVNNLFSFPPLARDWVMGYTPTLDEYCIDLTTTDYQIKIRNIVNREKEINEIERSLCKSSEANVIIVGEEGVGKHTIVDALAKKIYEGRTNDLIMYKRVLKLNMEKILTQYTDQKQREYFFEELMKEAADAKNIILMIDDLDRYISEGQNRVDLTSSLEKFAQSSKVHVIGITPPFFYQKFIYNNDKINRLFNKINVYEVNKAEAEKILLNNILIFEQRHQVKIPYETLKNTIEKSDFYLTYIPFPEKAIELLDSACVYIKQQKQNIVNPEIIDQILSEKTHIPTTISEEMKTKLTNLENLLMQTIVQQEEAIKELSSALRRSFMLIGKRKKPLASFLFLGPTGVGKTETAKSIAKVFFGADKYLIRFDMSSYQSKEDIPKLLGSIDNNNPGLLTQAIRENPYGVLLLDELEKADKDLLNIFLTIIDEGYFTDGFGKRVDCKNLVIIATSNAGDNYEKIFSPEFLNRFDGVVVYKSLGQSAIAMIAKTMINNISENILKMYEVKLIVSQNFIDNLINQGYNEKFGARNLERIIRAEIEDKVAKMILENKVKEGDSINL